MKKEVSIVIPNYNGVYHLLDFLYSIELYNREGYEVIVVDNGSRDGSNLIITQLFPWIKLVELSENVGFGGAVNIGIDESKGDFIVILNNDTFWTGDWIGEGVKFLKENRDYYFVSPLVLYRDGRKIDSAGDFISLFFSPYKVLNGMEYHDGMVKECDIFFSSCSAVIIRREFFYRCGNFDEDFFMYFEDSDLFFRSFVVGLKGKLLPQLKVYHKEGGTSLKEKDGRGKRHYYLFRNSFYLAYKNLPGTFFWIYFPVIFLHRVFLFLKWERMSNFKIFINSLSDFFKDIENLRKKRMANRKKRKVSHFEIFSTILKNSKLAKVLKGRWE